MGQNLAPDVIEHQAVTIAATATLIVPLDMDRQQLILVNMGSTDVFLGNSDVTSANGVLLVGTKGAYISWPTSAALYGITSGGTQEIRVGESF